MGDIAEMMLEGILCATCGDFLKEEPSGFPEDCDNCALEAEDE
jgi:hypothetical protein